MTRRRFSLANGTSKGLVLDLIRAQGPISRVELAAATGMTQATMTTLVRQLISEGLVGEAGQGASTGGKPPTMLDVIADSRFAIGVQLGVESTTYVVIDLMGAIVGRIRARGVGTSPPATMVAAVARQIEQMLTTLDIAKGDVVGVGVVAPGPLDLVQGTIFVPPHLREWHDVPIRDMIAEATGLPVLLDNDATAAAVGDFWTGNLDDATAHATVFMGAGIGAGILIDGTVLRGASSNAGELGHIPIIIEGRETMLKDVAAPAAIARHARETGLAERLGPHGPDEFDVFRKVASAAVRGDVAAHALIETSAGHLATAATIMANLFDLDSISLAGPAFVVAGSIYVQAMSRRLESQFFPRPHHSVTVRLSTEVTDAAAVGGAALVLQAQLAPRTLGLTAVR